MKKFKSKDLELLSNEFCLQSKSQFHNVENQIRRKLKILLDANNWKDLLIFPGNRPEKLKNSDLCSIRINDQYRLTFIWENNQAWEIDINSHDKNYGK